MNNGMKFNAEFQRSKGNFLNLHEGLIEDLVSKSDGRSQERYDYQKKLRAKYLPEIPGYVPKNPIYKAEVDRTLDYLIELRVKASDVNKDTPFTAHLTTLREIFNAATSFNTLRHPIQAPLNILRGYSDGIGEGARARNRIMMQFNDQVYAYTVLANTIYISEKKDSPSWQLNEKYRADVSRNRLESFFLNNGLAGLHHDQSNAIAEMEKCWRGEQERLMGAYTRRGMGILGDNATALIWPAYQFGGTIVQKGKELKNKVSEFFWGG